MRWSMLSVLLAGILGSCGDPAGPPDPQGNWEVVRANGKALPLKSIAFHTVGTANCIEDFTGGSLHMDGDRYYSYMRTSLECGEGAGDVPPFVSDQSRGTFQQAGRLLFFEASLTGAFQYEQGTIEGREIRVRVHRADGLEIDLLLRPWRQ